MKLLEIFIGSLIILSLSSCVTELPLPVVEDCIVISSGVFCIDKRLPEGKQEYDLRFDQVTGYSCTSPRDRQLLINDITEVRTDYLKLKNNSNADD